eukprot:4453609-Pleurochrysis_carterae.AAC.1
MAMPWSMLHAIRRGRHDGRKGDDGVSRPLLERVPWSKSPRTGSRCQRRPTVVQLKAVSRS